MRARLAAGVSLREVCDEEDGWRDDEDCYCPSPERIAAMCADFNQRNLAAMRAQGETTNHNPVGNIRECSTRGNRRLSTVGVLA